MDAVHFFLTYSQCTLTHERVLSFLQSVKPVVWCRVAVETHEDGNPHVHVCVRFGERVRTRNTSNQFDCDGFHPSIEVARDYKKVLGYLSKEGNYVDTGPVPTCTGIYDDLVAAGHGGDRSAFDRVALENRVSFQWAQHIWDGCNAINANTILEPGQGTECLQLQQLQLYPGSMCIIGPSGCGKSTWAKRVSPKPALWVTHLDDLKKLTKHHKCIIFDDMAFHHHPRTSQIHLADQDDVRSIHVRYAVVTIPANMPKIFTANSKPFDDDEAINRRVHYVNIISLAI